MDEELQIVEVGSNLFQFKFKSGFELDRVLKGGPWTFDNQALMLRRWQLGMTAANVKFDSIALWIQIWDAPFDMISPIVVAEIGNRLGEVVEVEKRRTQDTQNFFMRVKVELPTSKPIRRGHSLVDQRVYIRGCLSSTRGYPCFAISVECWVMILNIVRSTLLG